MSIPDIYALTLLSNTFKNVMNYHIILVMITRIMW